MPWLLCADFALQKHTKKLMNSFRMSFSQLLSDFGVSFQKEVVEQKNFGFLDLKFDRNKKRQETDFSGKKRFLPEYVVLSDYFKTSQIQNVVVFLQKKIVNMHCGFFRLVGICNQYDEF